MYNSDGEYYQLASFAADGTFQSSNWYWHSLGTPVLNAQKHTWSVINGELIIRDSVSGDSIRSVLRSKDAANRIYYIHQYYPDLTELDKVLFFDQNTGYAQVQSYVGSIPPPTNLIVNSGFETPDIPPGVSVGPVGGWKDFSTPILGWIPVDKFEILDHVIPVVGYIWEAYEGDQFAQLESYGNGGISQTISTTPGQTYVLIFAYSPRPAVAANSNIINIYINDVSFGYVTEDGTGMINTSWYLYRGTFTATGTSTTIKFLASGISDNYGGFLDDVWVYVNN